jgi:hypothetical protein
MYLIRSVFLHKNQTVDQRSTYMMRREGGAGGRRGARGCARARGFSHWSALLHLLGVSGKRWRVGGGLGVTVRGYSGYNVSEEKFKFK